MRVHHKRRLTVSYIQKLKPQSKTYLVWDLYQRGLALSVSPAGRRTWLVVYSLRGRSRWYTLAPADAISLPAARSQAAEIMLEVIKGGDPAAEKQTRRSAGTFEELATRYRDEWAKKKNKSWRQADKLVRGYVFPRWASLQANSITRSDVKSLLAKIESPTVANQVLASTSAIFTWAMKEAVGCRRTPARRLGETRLLAASAFSVTARSLSSGRRLRTTARSATR